MTLKTEPAILALADGTLFRGRRFGASGTCVGEVVFTTGMSGYQEILTDPSYTGQIVNMTATQIGNTGIVEEDGESRKNRPMPKGFVVRDLSLRPSNWRSQESLPAYLERNGVVGITEINTRALTQHLRDNGSMNGAIGSESPEALVRKAKEAPSMKGLDLVKDVTCSEAYEVTSGQGRWGRAEPKPATRHVVALDFGLKQNIARCLVDAGCKVTVVPATTSAADILAMGPDGVFLSNGPGDPAPVTYAIRTIKDLLGKTPIFGICLGHQLLALALGGSTRKMKFGHRGLNHPVLDIATGKVEITSQNHGFVVEEESLKGKAEVTHKHLNDESNEGLSAPELSAFSVQYHPESAAGPHDSRYLFERFVKLIDRFQANALGL